MAARYADAANIVAQGQSFYTGLLPGSYENTGGVLKGNVYGKGSGGSANVTADRTGSEAAALSIGDYKAKAGPTPASIFKPGEEPSDTDRIVNAIGRGPINRGPTGGVPTPDPTGGVPTPDPTQKGGDPAADDGGPGLPERFGGDAPEAAEALMPQAERLKWAAGGLPNPPQRSGTNPFGDYKGLPWGTNQAPSTDPGPMGTGQKTQHRSVQGMASTRTHTRQPGVQASATQQSIPFPSMPNSTNRSLKF